MTALPAAELRKHAFKILLGVKGATLRLLGVHAARGRALWLTMNARTGTVRLALTRADSTDTDWKARVIGSANFHPWERGWAAQSHRPFRNKRCAKLPLEDCRLTWNANAPKYVREMISLADIYPLIPSLRR